MKQALLYSINAEHLANILNGNKTIEVRKRDLPQWAKDKLARGEKVVGYGYCTKKQRTIMVLKKGEEMFGDVVDKTVFVKGEIANDYNKTRFMAGRVVVKFEVSGSEKHEFTKTNIEPYGGFGEIVHSVYGFPIALLEKCCLSMSQVEYYSGGDDLYFHHLTNIQPVNMELGEFYKKGKYENSGFFMAHRNEYNFYKHLTKAPQSFQTVWVKGE